MPTTYKVNHVLKSHPEPFRAVWEGIKNHEIRINDRGFKNDQVIRLREFTPTNYAGKGDYSGRALDIMITAIRFAPGEGSPSSAGLVSRFVVFDFLVLTYFRKEDDPGDSDLLSPPPFTTTPNPEA